MIPSCREVICLRSRTVSPLPVAQRIRREVSQSVETQTEHKLPGGTHQHKPRDLATSEGNSVHRGNLQHFQEQNKNLSETTHKIIDFMILVGCEEAES